MKPPNILFFFSDQPRWDTCGCCGQPLPVTPHLDRMDLPLTFLRAAGASIPGYFLGRPLQGLYEPER